MIPQQMQLQQIQIQGQPQQQFVNQDQQQQIQNQIMQSQQMALQQQNTLNANQANGIQQITIQQPKQIIVGQQNVGQSQASLENRPIISMVSIGGSNAASSLNAMQNLSSPIGSPQLTLQPQPNPLAAMTSLSYSAVPSGTMTNSVANISKEDKHTSKVDDAPKIVSESVGVSTSTSSTVTTISNGSITISSATSSPAVTNASKDKSSGNLKLDLFLFVVT